MIFVQNSVNVIENIWSRSDHIKRLLLDNDSRLRLTLLVCLKTGFILANKRSSFFTSQNIVQFVNLGLIKMFFTVISRMKNLCLLIFSQIFKGNRENQNVKMLAKDKDLRILIIIFAFFSFDRWKISWGCSLSSSSCVTGSEGKGMTKFDIIFEHIFLLIESVTGIETLWTTFETVAVD